jgi:preprotein translocase subunit SecD
MLHNVSQYGLAGLGVLFAVLAWAVRSKRGVFGWAAASAAFAAVAGHYDVFWATVTFSLTMIWALFCALNTIDLAWRAKTGFVLFLALGAGVVIYPTYHDERYGREDYPVEMPAEQRQDLDNKAKHGELGFRKWLRANIPFRLVRGLDLKGGLRLVYTVEVERAIEDKRDYYYDELRQALAQALGFSQKDKQPTVEELAKLPTKVKIDKSRDQASVITVTFSDPADSAVVNDQFLTKFLNELQVQRSSDRKQVTFRISSRTESDIRERAVTQAQDTVHRRVDDKGVKEASVTARDEDIIIEMPGEDEAAFAAIRELVSTTARMDFKMVDDNVDYFDPILRSAKAEDLPKGLEPQAESAPIGPSKQKVVRYAQIKRLGSEDLSATLKRLKEWTSTLQVDPDHEIGFGKVTDYNEETDTYEDIGWRTYYLFSKAEVTGDMIREPHAINQQSSDRGLGGWVVTMEFNSQGADRFEEVTGKNIGRRFAIILDGKVESAPRIISKIAGGHCQITMGAGSPEQQLTQAKKLEIVLKSGSLPAPISLSNEQRIGPSLGRDSLALGLKGAASGGVLVLIFMVVYYSRAGFIADIAVLFNLVLQVAILAMFGASMTLPGIAGLVLTIGIAVDANVLINERIREELRHGKTARHAVDVGYDKAFSAILDGHVTTLISGLILYQYGTGPIKGFAVTLMVGIAASLFTGVVCTRLMFDWAVRGRRLKKLSLG